jgi:colanic acid biosynthesis glycosyl transferase WcaI
MRALVLGLNYAPERTGIAPYTTGLARMLADAGVDVHVITGLPHYPEWQVAARYRGGPRLVEERDGDIRITRVRHDVPTRPTGAGRVLMEARWAAAAARVPTAAPDVVIAVSPALLGVGAALAHARRAPWRRPAVGVVVQDLYAGAVAEAGALGGRAARSVAALESSLLRRADGVVGVHEVFRGGLERAGVRPDRVQVVRNWTHTGRPAVSADLRAVRRGLGWSQDEVIALHAGNMGAKQGLETLVDAARRADEGGHPVRFVLLGDGNQREHLERLGAGVGRLQFLETLPAARFESALAAADVLVLHERPGVVEMCAPSKLTSYFDSGRPVVAATDPASAAARDMRAAGAGPVVAPGDPAALLDAVLALAADPDRAARHGAGARSFAARTYAPEAAREAYLAWVTALAQGSPRTRPLRPAERASTPAPVRLPS